MATSEERQSPWRVARSVFSNRPFMNILVFNLAWGVCGSFAGMFPMVYMIREVEIPYKFIALLGNVGALVSLLGWPVWGVLADMYGNRAVMKIGYGWMAVGSLLWVLVNRHTWYVLLPLMNLAGGFVGPSTVGMTNLMLKAAPRENQSAYFAIFGSATAVTAAFAPTIGGAILETMQSHDFDPLGIGRYRMLFGGVGVLLVSCLLLLRGIQEPDRAVSTRYVIAQAWSWHPLAVAVHLLRLSRRTHQRKRERAAAALGDLRSRLATDELARSLEDPSLRVRREAARSLGEIGDLNATRHLIAALGHPLAEIRQESALALGKARVPVDIDPLLRCLADPDPLVQSSAAVALGEIGDERAALPLLGLLHSSAECTVRAAAASGIASLGRKGDVTYLLAGLEREEIHVVQHQFVFAIGTLLGGPDEFYSRAGSQRTEQEKMVYRVVETDRLTALTRHHLLSTIRDEVEGRLSEALRFYQAGHLNEAMQEIRTAAQLVVNALSAAYGKGTIHWPEDHLRGAEEPALETLGITAAASVIEFVARRAASANKTGHQIPWEELVLGVYAYRRLLIEVRSLLEGPSVREKKVKRR